MLVCSGSIPPGAPPGAYGRLVEIARARGAIAVVDASGAALAEALGARPDAILPNLGEAEQLLGRGAAEDVDAARGRAAARARRRAASSWSAGAAAAVVTAAAAGRRLVDGQRAEWLPAPVVTVRNPIGAGDAFAAGLAVALEQGADLLAAARAGIAAGAASVEHPLAGALDPARARELAAATWGHRRRWETAAVEGVGGRCTRGARLGVMVSTSGSARPAQPAVPTPPPLTLAPSGQAGGERRGRWCAHP